jgi:hypothetical protein
MTNTKQAQFEGGAKRGSRKPPYFLVPVELMEAVAWTRLEGDVEYEPGNWMDGDREFFVDCLGHAIEHLLLAPFDYSEDHFGHAATNIGFILWAIKHGKVERSDFSNAAKLLAAGPGTRDPNGVAGVSAEPQGPLP